MPSYKEGHPSPSSPAECPGPCLHLNTSPVPSWCRHWSLPGGEGLAGPPCPGLWASGSPWPRWSQGNESLGFGIRVTPTPNPRPNRLRCLPGTVARVINALCFPGPMFPLHFPPPCSREELSEGSQHVDPHSLMAFLPQAAPPHNRVTGTR